MQPVTNLPSEILIQITEALYSRDVKFGSSLSVLHNRRKTDWASVSSLSRTCRAFRRIAQPQLFRSVFTTDQLRKRRVGGAQCDRAETPAAVALVRSLMLRPDLAEQVQDLLVGGWLTINCVSPPDTSPRMQTPR